MESWLSVNAGARQIRDKRFLILVDQSCHQWTRSLAQFMPKQPFSLHQWVASIVPSASWMVVGKPKSKFFQVFTLTQLSDRSRDILRRKTLWSPCPAVSARLGETIGVPVAIGLIFHAITGRRFAHEWNLDSDTRIDVRCWNRWLEGGFIRTTQNGALGTSSTSLRNLSIQRLPGEMFRNSLMSMTATRTSGFRR